MDVVSYVLAKKQAGNVGFPENSTSGKVLSVDVNGNRVWSYPLVMDATLTEGYQAKLNNVGIPQELFVIDIAKPQFGTFIMKPDYFTCVRIKNGNTILVSSFSTDVILDKLEIESINESGVQFLGLMFNGSATRYHYSIAENTWNQSTVSYSSSKLDTLLSEKISFNNETEFIPVEAYNPATKKYVDDSIASIGEAASTDSEIIDVLIQEDMLFAFTDSTGSILTDENNNILTW